MPRPWTGRIDLNLLEMSLALSSTVLITEAATHWSDWQVGWRSLAGLPTVVLRWSRQKRLHLHHYGGRTGPNCTSTYRSVCVEAAGGDAVDKSVDAIKGTILAEARLCTEKVYWGPSKLWC